MALKVDMSKAYDRVSWNFLMAILWCFGFGKKWCCWIYHCISMVSFSIPILLYRSPYGFFKPQQGLQQGDPLSPFLFVMFTEVLTRLIHKEEARGNIHGIRIARYAPLVSNMFADDIMLFCRANSHEVLHLQQDLTTFAAWSEQEINTAKSFVHFSFNMELFARILWRNYFVSHLLVLQVII